MCAIAWPSALLDIVTAHLVCVERGEDATLPPLYTAEYNIYDFFVAHRVTIAQHVIACARSEAAVEGACDTTVHLTDADATALTECVVRLALGLLEQSCTLSFLHLRERRVVSTATTQKEKRLLGALRQRTANRRRRLEDLDDVFGGARFSRVLTLEYLLRFFLVLPAILQHYDKLGGAVMPAYAVAPLWCVVNATLQVLHTHCMHQFYTTTAYISIR